MRSAMTNEPEQDDSKLSTIKAALAGKPMAIDALLEDYLPHVRAFVRMKLGKELRKREAETDIVQSTCRRVLAYQGSGLQFEREAKATTVIALLEEFAQQVRRTVCAPVHDSYVMPSLTSVTTTCAPP